MNNSMGGLITRAEKVVVTLQAGEAIFKGETIAVNLTQQFNSDLVYEMGRNHSVAVAGPMEWGLELKGIGDMNFALADYGLTDHWICLHCTSGNPDKYRSHTYKPVERIFHCLKCGSPRPHFTL